MGCHAACCTTAIVDFFDLARRWSCSLRGRGARSGQRRAQRHGEEAAALAVDARSPPPELRERCPIELQPRRTTRRGRQVRAWTSGAGGGSGCGRTDLSTDANSDGRPAPARARRKISQLDRGPTSGVEHQPWPVRRSEALPEVEARVSEPALKPFGHSRTLSLVDWVDSASRCSGVLIASRCIVADRLLPEEGKQA
jgi:hypothetical protein